MMVKKYKSRIVSIQNPLDDIFTVELESLSGKYKYLPGQFLHLALDEYDPSVQWPESRCFSMQSSSENHLIKITYAVKGNFTQRMTKELFPGRQIWIKLPYGDLFSQSHSNINTVFIAGGTGITPFLSLFCNHSFSNYINPVLYAGFRTKEMNIYKKELKQAEEVNSSLITKYIYQDTQGIINFRKILNETDHSASFFISGPPGMIKSCKDALIANGINKSQIKTDDWE